MTTRACLAVALLAFFVTGVSRASPPMGLSASGKVTVVMTAATLGDDCGAEIKQAKAKAKSDMKAERSCQPSSMQLAVSGAQAGGSIAVQVKKVELFDDAGALVGELTAQSPTVWADSGSYQPWNQTVAPGQNLKVSYTLGQPNWSAVKDRWNRTFVVKAVISVGGGDQTFQKDVRVAAPPTSLPANVKT